MNLDDDLKARIKEESVLLFNSRFESVKPLVPEIYHDIIGELYLMGFHDGSLHAVDLFLQTFNDKVDEALKESQKHLQP